VSVKDVVLDFAPWQESTGEGEEQCAAYSSRLFAAWMERDALVNIEVFPPSVVEPMMHDTLTWLETQMKLSEISDLLGYIRTMGLFSVIVERVSYMHEHPDMPEYNNDEAPIPHRMKIFFEDGVPEDYPYEDATPDEVARFRQHYFYLGLAMASMRAILAACEGYLSKFSDLSNSGGVAGASVTTEVMQLTERYMTRDSSTTRTWVELLPFSWIRTWWKERDEAEQGRPQDYLDQHYGNGDCARYGLGQTLHFRPLAGRLDLPDSHSDAPPLIRWLRNGVWYQDSTVQYSEEALGRARAAQQRKKIFAALDLRSAARPRRRGWRRHC